LSKGKGQFWLNLGRPSETNGDGDALFPKYFRGEWGLVTTNTETRVRAFQLYC